MSIENDYVEVIQQDDNEDQIAEIDLLISGDDVLDESTQRVNNAIRKMNEILERLVDVDGFELYGDDDIGENNLDESLVDEYVAEKAKLLNEYLIKYINDNSLEQDDLIVFLNSFSDEKKLSNEILKIVKNGNIDSAFMSSTPDSELDKPLLYKLLEKSGYVKNAGSKLKDRGNLGNEIE